MSQKKQRERSQIFELDIVDIRAMQETLAEIISLHQKEALSKFMVEENMLHYSHGIRWKNPANDFAEDGEMESMTAEYSIQFQRIVDGDLTLMTESIDSIAKQMSDGFIKKMYETMSDACDRSGNVVSGKAFPESFLEALEKIEFSVDKNGEVQLPSFHHAGSSSQIEQLQGQSQEFHDKVEEVKARKSAAAEERERERLGRYKVASQ
jgi:hypothetical protein